MSFSEPGIPVRPTPDAFPDINRGTTEEAAAPARGPTINASEQHALQSATQYWGGMPSMGFSHHVNPVHLAHPSARSLGLGQNLRSILRNMRSGGFESYINHMINSNLRLLNRSGGQLNVAQCNSAEDLHQMARNSDTPAVFVMEHDGVAYVPAKHATGADREALERAFGDRVVIDDDEEYADAVDESSHMIAEFLEAYGFRRAELEPTKPKEVARTRGSTTVASGGADTDVMLKPKKEAPLPFFPKQKIQLFVQQSIEARNAIDARRQRELDAEHTATAQVHEEDAARAVRMSEDETLQVNRDSLQRSRRGQGAQGREGGNEGGSRPTRSI